MRDTKPQFVMNRQRAYRYVAFLSSYSGLPKVVYSTCVNECELVATSHDYIPRGHMNLRTLLNNIIDIFHGH